MNHLPNPQTRRSIRKMGGNSEECAQNPSSSHGLKCAKKDGSTFLSQSDSTADDECNSDSGTGDSQSPNIPECTKESSASPYSQSPNKPEHTKESSASSYSQSPNKPERTKESSASSYFNSLKRTEIIKQLQKYRKILLFGIVLVSAITLAYFWKPTTLAYFWASTTQDTEKVNKMSLEETIEHIREEFPSQREHIWANFLAGIKETAQRTPTKPSVFMLLFETEEGTAICLAQKLGNMFTHVLEADKSNPLLIIDGADLEHNETLAEDYGTLLEEYRPKVEEQRVMIINNLHKIPGTVAQSFHSFCDTFEPAVGKAAYLFTMKASGVPSNRHNPTEVAEEELRKLWSDELDEDRLNPLITRITDMTMIIRPEKNLAPCHS